MYITFEEYQDYGGTLDEPTFNSIYYDVQIKIDYYTFNRLVNDTVFTEKVKRCIVKLISLLNIFNEYQKTITDLKHPVVASASNDGVSMSYGGYLGNTTPNDLNTVQEQLDKDILNTIKQYLYGEKNQAGEVLLYRGIYK